MEMNTKKIIGAFGLILMAGGMWALQNSGANWQLMIAIVLIIMGNDFRKIK